MRLHYFIRILSLKIIQPYRLSPHCFVRTFLAHMSTSSKTQGRLGIPQGRTESRDTEPKTQNLPHDITNEYHELNSFRDTKIPTIKP